MPEFLGHKNHTDPWTRIDNSMVLTTKNLPDTILSTEVQEPPVNKDLDGEKPSRHHVTLPQAVCVRGFSPVQVFIDWRFLDRGGENCVRQILRG